MAPEWTATRNMLEAHSGPATLLLDGRVLVAGGTDSAGFRVSTAELYDPSTGAWTATGSMIEGRLGHNATLLLDGRVLVAGGSGDIRGRTAELYDPASGTWTATGSMITPRWDHTATLLPDGRVLVAGGSAVQGTDSPLALASAELYDPGSGTWTATGNMVEARIGRTATLLLNGNVLVLGGIGSADSARLESAELYDPSSGSWIATGGMIDDRFGHRATLLLDGRVLVAGGGGFGIGLLASAELYDPSSGTWTATGSMITPRWSHTATLLLDGTVLVAGGDDGRGTDGLLASAEVYDPSRGSWTATASMTEARTGHTATLLLEGTVLGAGGYSSLAGLVSAELYDPGSGT